MEDPYGTAAIRERVLAAWSASPSRFREDANTEEDHARGGYRDRVIIELAQNAADAAARAGVPGRIRFTLRDGVLTAANTGASLDAAGVEALSTLRASAKRDEAASTGRFGVGFAAVVAVSDEPAIASRGVPGVGWSAARTRALVAGVPSLAEELDRRGGGVPLLRPPSAGGTSPPPACRSPRPPRCPTGSTAWCGCPCATPRPRRSYGGCWRRPGRRSCSRSPRSPRSSSTPARSVR